MHIYIYIYTRFITYKYIRRVYTCIIIYTMYNNNMSYHTRRYDYNMDTHNCMYTNIINK